MFDFSGSNPETSEAEYAKGATRAPSLNLAEREGFEPSIRGYRIHTFQACAFDRSATSPVCSCAHRDHETRDAKRGATSAQCGGRAANPCRSRRGPVPDTSGLVAPRARPLCGAIARSVFHTTAERHRQHRTTALTRANPFSRRALGSGHGKGNPGAGSFIPITRISQNFPCRADRERHERYHLPHLHHGCVQYPRR